MSVSESTPDALARRIRSDFPILSRAGRNGRPVAYLDSAATSQKPRAVIDATSRYYEQSNSNVHRAIHQWAEQATEQFEQARSSLAKLIGAAEEREIIFTRGTTEGINLVAHGWGNRNLKAGDRIVCTVMEHHSNMVPWQMLATRTGATIEYVPVLDDGTLGLPAYEKALDGGAVKLVAVTHMSNVLGTINPAKRLIESAHRAGAKVLLDGAQSVPHFPVNVQSLDCDFLAFSGHKMCGPTGIGVLYGPASMLESMDPFLGGGEMISRVTLNGSTWADLPHKFEAGTPDIAGAIGLGAAVEYLSGIGMDVIEQQDRAMTAYTINALHRVPGLRVFGSAAERGGAISFALEGVHPHDIAHFIDQDGVAIRAGHMCAQPLMNRFGVPAMGRASLYIYTTTDDVDRLVSSLERVRGYFNRGHR